MDTSNIEIRGQSADTVIIDELNDSRSIPAAAPRYNRHQRRAMMALQLKAQKEQVGKSERRLVAFNKLQAWKDKEGQRDKFTPEQINAVFKVAVNKIFKEDFKEHMSFENRLSAIARNVKKGFVYNEMKYVPDSAIAEAQSEAVAEG